jgi:hypothetical protein
VLARLRLLARSAFRRDQLEREMSEEFGFHLERRIEDLTRAGVPPTEAARRARLEFGAREAYKEQCREARGLRFFDECGQDLRYAFRTLRTNPGFAAVAILSLALGIGANTAIFSLLDAVMLKSLPVSRPDELLLVNSAGPSVRSDQFSYPMFQRFRELAPVAGMSRVATLNTLAPGERQPASASGQLVSGDYFKLLGVYPELGRLLTSESHGRRASGGCRQRRILAAPAGRLAGCPGPADEAERDVLHHRRSGPAGIFGRVGGFACRSLAPPGDAALDTLRPALQRQR